MFDLKEFITKNIVNGIKKGAFAKEYGNIMAVNYLAKGILTEDDVAGIDTAITAWEAEKTAKEIPETATGEEIPTGEAAEETSAAETAEGQVTEPESTDEVPEEAVKNEE